jgi:c-di-GMP-binding flagellar brake protein YcgR
VGSRFLPEIFGHGCAFALHIKEVFMENRWVQRQPTDCEVILETPEAGQIRARARNISLGGMFLVTDTETPPIESLVDLDFTLLNADLAVHHHLPGQVVHTSGEGVGVMFCDFNPATLSSMRKTLASRY